MKKVILILTLSLIAGISGFVLSNVNAITEPIIKAADEAKEESMFKNLFPELETYEKALNEDEDSMVKYSVKVLNKDKKVIGNIYNANGTNGYGSITALIGIDSKGKITGIEYPVFKQTPGFGDKVIKEGYLNQYKEMDSKDVNPDAASGATYSSNLVKSLVAAMGEFHNKK